MGDKLAKIRELLRAHPERALRILDVLDTKPPGHEQAIEWGCECESDARWHRISCVYGGVDND